MTKPGPTPQRPYRAARAGRRLLTALVGLLLVLAAVVVGAVPAAAQNAVGASTTAAANTVGVSTDIGAGQRLGNTAPQPQIVVATAVAAEGGLGGGGNIVIGKVADLEAPGALGPGESTLLDRLPNLGSPKANWAQNSGVLRSEMGRGVPIRDASVNPVTGELVSDTGFLRAERYLLGDRGWTFDPKTTFWSPPVG